MKDFLVDYLTPNGFDLPRLLDDDYFIAIKLLWNHKQYVSAMKLLLSFIDTIGYIEFGDIPNNFQQWLHTYAELTSIGVTADEIWELRNSLLHMSNADSRKVLSGKVRRIFFYVGTLPASVSSEGDTAKYLDFWQLIQMVANASTRFCESFNVDPTKFLIFVDRYDRVLSDSRQLEIQFTSVEHTDVQHQIINQPK